MIQSNVPTYNEIVKIHKAYAPTPEVFAVIFGHCEIVTALALDMAQTSNDSAIDIDIVRAGGLLHDIGVYEFYDKDGKLLDDIVYLTHGILGEKILRSEGMPESLCRIASHHTGSGLTKEHILKRGLPLPAADFLAESTEERLIMYADKFHSKTDPPVFNSYEWYLAHVQQFGTSSVERFIEMSQEFGIPNVAEYAMRYKQLVRG